MPKALIDAIGQTRTFVIKVSKHNLEGKTQSLTVTKVLAPVVSPLEGDLDDEVVVPPAAESLQLGNHSEGASTGNEEPADERVKRSTDVIVAEEAKRAKCG